jgi:hypothetical protein
MDIQVNDDVVVSLKEDIEIETIPEGINDVDRGEVTVHKAGEKIEGPVAMFNPETGHIAIQTGEQETHILFLNDLNVLEINGKKPKK